MDKPVTRKKLYAAILEEFSPGTTMTARECAELLRLRGIVHFGIRQEVQPRICELLELGKMEAVGQKYDSITQKTVTEYRAVRER